LHHGYMDNPQRRRSVTLPPKIAKQVETLARERDLGDNRVLVELAVPGLINRVAAPDRW
jgi:hypothetical protein